MEYGDIFVGTFRTIWRHKKLWLFAILGQLIAAVFGAILGGIFSLRFLNNWFDLMRQFMQSGPAQPGQLPERLLGQFFAGWGLFACLLALIAVANYVVNLIMRGAIIAEAGTAWRGAATDTRRGLQTGANRAPYVFALDVLWRVPLAIIVGGAWLGGLVALIVTVAGLVRQGNQGSTGAAVFLTLCGGICCLVILGLLIAVFVGIFQPLMYQSAVQGRRSLGEAIAEGWNLARSHVGPMFIFWVLSLLVGLVAWLLVQLVAQPLSFAWSSSLSSWITRAMEGITSGTAPALPPIPATSSSLYLLMIVVVAILGLFANSFVAAFNLTLYAGVYGRLAGGALARAAGPTPSGSPPAAGLQEPVEPPAASSGQADIAPEEPPPASGGARTYEGPDLGLSVRDQPAPPDEENRPHV